MLKKLAPRVLLMMALYAGHAFADEPAQGVFAFNGFGTFGLVHSSNDLADFTASNFEPNGAGYTRAWSESVDSLIGGQVTANIAPRLSAVLQLVVQQNYNDSYWPHVEWANIKYQFSSDFDVRVGRIVQPTFLLSDSRQVGYANPWVRPPTEVYNLNPTTSLNGVDTSYRFHVGDVTNAVQANYGANQSFRFPADVHLDDSSAWGIFDTLEYGAALLHLGYAATSISLSSPADELFAGFEQFGPQGAAIAHTYDAVNKSATFIALGASYNPGQWFAMGEWSRSRSDSYIGESTGWYVSAGYRIRAFTPYLTHAQVTESIRSATGLTVADLPLSEQPVATVLNAGLNTLIESRPVQYTSSMGVRWDARTNIDVKMQLDRINLGSNSPGTLSNIQPGFSSGSVLYVFSAALDFVF